MKYKGKIENDLDLVTMAWVKEHVTSGEEFPTSPKDKAIFVLTKELPKLDPEGKVSGIYKFKDELENSGWDQSVNFVTDGVAHTRLILRTSEALYYDTSSGLETGMYWMIPKTWEKEAYKTIDFGETEQTVYLNFWQYLQRNAIKQNPGVYKTGVYVYDAATSSWSQVASNITDYLKNSGDVAINANEDGKCSLSLVTSDGTLKIDKTGIHNADDDITFASIKELVTRDGALPIEKADWHVWFFNKAVMFDGEVDSVSLQYYAATLPSDVQKEAIIYFKTTADRSKTLSCTIQIPDGYAVEGDCYNIDNTHHQHIDLKYNCYYKIIYTYVYDKVLRCSILETPAMLGRETETGFVFYDKGYYSDGWRFMECAKEFLPTKYVWGDDGAMGITIQAGQAYINTDIIIEKSTTRPDNAAKACKDYTAGGYNWALPTQEELYAIYTNIVAKGIHTFTPNVNDIAWSSGDITGEYTYAPTYNLSNGTYAGYQKSVQFNVLPIRYF